MYFFGLNTASFAFLFSQYSDYVLLSQIGHRLRKNQNIIRLVNSVAYLLGCKSFLQFIPAAKAWNTDGFILVELFLDQLFLQCFLLSFQFARNSFRFVFTRFLLLFVSLGYDFLLVQFPFLETGLYSLVELFLFVDWFRYFLFGQLGFFATCFPIQSHRALGLLSVIHDDSFLAHYSYLVLYII